MDIHKPGQKILSHAFPCLPREDKNDCRSAMPHELIMAEAKKKCRQYNVEYLKYGFIPSPSNPQQPFCLICEKAFANELMKPSKLVKHLKTMHGDNANKDLSYFHSRPKLPGIFSSASRRNTDGLRASYNISLLIAKCGKPHAVGCVRSAAYCGAHASN
ncbi:hypothetical protein M513_04465 [Trichuris suis]|uniref:Uncharacterized protein n=1 Tax=Trichuris suis TaxID=68888 RepID=A0A085MC19_9BILA|nr:hypothetical protein M513_04465 [Trichuris suis]